MEIEASTSEVAKKLWNIVRIAFAMMRKGMSKSKMMMELNLLFKRGKLAGKAVAESLMVLHQHHSSASAALSCRSGDAALSFVSPRDYEFSCSNSPAFPKRRRHHHNHHRHVISDSEAFAAVQKMLEAYEASASPALPGFAATPAAVRQLRITDSPFPIKDEGLGDSLVDAKAEDFIKKFYKNLKQQKKTAYLESPYRPVY